MSLTAQAQVSVSVVSCRVVCVEIEWKPARERERERAVSFSPGRSYGIDVIEVMTSLGVADT